jgi:amino-acid N-acetyltransferase
VLRQAIFFQLLAATPASEVPLLTIRPARVSDVPGIQQQIQVFADRGLMIRRSLAELYQAIREFLVAVDQENRVIGCVALHVFWDDLAEIRCLAVAPDVQGLGIGRRLVEACWELARELEVKSIFALTSSTGFFERCGYQQIEKTELPQAVWSECVRCPSFPNCQEAALIRLVDREANAAEGAPRLAAADV